jgi:hypothetical protein
MEQVLRLRRILEQPVVRRETAERCEFCGVAVPAEHSHVVDIENRRIVCSCRPCWLLFTNPGAAGGKFRSAGDRRERVESTEFDTGEFATPVGMAFFIRNSKTGAVSAFFPSPGGATESGLSFDGDQPALRRLEADIEALLIYQRGSQRECWIVPIDACYELVGRIRRYWRGFDGGLEARREIESFFEKLGENRGFSCSI